MAFQVFYDNVLSTMKITDVSAEQPVETEILLADYDAPVFKVVKTTMEHSITQKYIMNGKLTVEGFIKLVVYYQPPENGPLNAVSQKIPFNKQLDVEPADTETAYISVTGQCQYVNTRPQNSTRIDIRGAYLFNIKVFAQISQKAMTAVKGEAVCCDTKQLDCFYLSGQNTRRFSLEDEITAGEDLSRVLRADSFAPAPAVTVYNDKMTVKGEIVSSVYYTTRDGAIKKYSHTFPYNQIIDMDGIVENNVVSAEVNIPSFAMSQNSETKKLTAKLAVNLDVCAFAKSQVIAVTDAFSRSFHYSKTANTTYNDTNMLMIDKAATLKIDAATSKGFVTQDIIFDVSPVKSYFEISKTTVKSKITAHIIGINNLGEYECFSAEGDLVLPWFENCRRQDEICIDVKVVSSSFTMTEQGVQINANCAVQGFVIEKTQCTILSEFAEDTDNLLENNNEALIIYYANKGERVFEIAKRHCADPQMIIEENNLTSDSITAPQMLFIPAFKG